MSTAITQALPRTPPEAQGVNSHAVANFVQGLKQIHELHSFMLLRHGCVIAEGWWSPYGRDDSHMVFSLSKSFTSTAVGLAVAEGRLSVNDTVLSFFPEAAPAEASEYLAAMRVHHLLTMSTGHAVDTWMPMVERADGDWVSAFFGVPVVHAPGSHFLYNTGASYMLSALLHRVTGMGLVEYLTPRLFEPLGIGLPVWEESPEGIALGGIGLRIKTEDIARFGQLYLQRGMWEGRSILPESWVRDAAAHQIANGDGWTGDWGQGYGYQFWRCRHGAYRGDGVFGQYCIIMPEQDAVLAITGGVDLFGMQEPLDLVWEKLLPAMGNTPLEEISGDHAQLGELLAGLKLPPVQGDAGSPIVTKVSGQTYRVNANMLDIETIRLEFETAGCTLTVKTTAGEEVIPCGFAAWRYGQTHLFNHPQLYNAALVTASSAAPTAASGAWTANDTFTMVVRLYESPFHHTVVCHFADDELMVETQVNVDFESPKKLFLTARYE